MPATVSIIGAGPAGLMAAEVIAGAGLAVDLYDAMPSVGRKFLRAGIGGLNLTHAEPVEDFLGRYGEHRPIIAEWLAGFGPAALRAWAAGLGIETFVGSSGRIFPVGMKAAPLLRAWLGRLHERGVRFHLRHRWLGWDATGALQFATPDGPLTLGAGQAAPGALLLALGGGSWARLGSDGAWLPLLAARGVAVVPLRPANCGFDCAWSNHLRDKCAGQPVKGVTATINGITRTGEFILTRHGVEGGLIYALAAPLRDAIERDGQVVLNIDLVPGRTTERLTADLQRPQGRDSLASHLRRRAGIEGVKAVLLREVAAPGQLHDPVRLAALLKQLPLRLVATRPLDEAISTAGGVRFAAVNSQLMLRELPGVFCAGEMLDWEAPTGGYLLTACFASGHRAGLGLLAYLSEKRE